MRIKSHKLFRVAVGAAMLLAAIPYPLSANPAQTSSISPSALAMWVWDARIVANRERQEQLFQFCKDKQIQILYFSAYNLKAPSDQYYRDFNRQAHLRGIQIHALAGDPRWGRPRYHHLPLEWVEQVRAFNQRAKPEERFDGVHTDIEVYLLSRSWREEPAHLLGGYLDLNAKLVQVLSEDQLRYGVDIPFWFDDDTTYRILWNNAIKSPSQHVMDMVDDVTVLAYRNFAHGPDGIIRLVALELSYAQEIGKTIRIGQETQEGLYPPYVTFAGTSCDELYAQMSEVRKAVKNKKSFGGFAIHHYESYEKLCAS